MDYAESGVNISLADQAKQRIRRLASRTFTPGVIGGIGSFGGLFALNTKKYKEPVLVSSADGVGTKLKIAMAMGIHSTVGADLVHHCVNDILTLGAEPLFFLDYLALGKIGSQHRRADCGGNVPRLPRHGLRLDRRRNGRDAGLLSAG